MLGAACVLALAIFILRALTAGAGDGLTFVYVVPVALIALELGAWPGIAAALGALALLAVGMLIRDTHLGPGDVLAHAVVFGTIGALCGRFSSRMRSARQRQRQLLDSGLALAELTDARELSRVIADSTLGLAPGRGARVTIEQLTPVQIGEMGGETVALKMRAGDIELGTIEVAAPLARPFTGDERLALEVLALQAATAAERQRLLALQRGQATLHAELSAAHGELAEQGTRLESVLAQQERERGDLADELQEEAAQTLAAVQLGLAAVERDLGSEPSRAQVETLRSSLADTSRTLRELAVGLRPPTLEQLGLGPALRTLAQRAAARSQHRIELDLDGTEHRLPPPLESAVYRLVDDIIGALAPAGGLSVGLKRLPGELKLVATQLGEERASSVPPDVEARIRARLALTAGRLTATRGGAYQLTAWIPIPDDQSAGIPSADPAGPS